MRRQHRLRVAADQQRHDGARQVLDEARARLGRGVLLDYARLGVLDGALFVRRLLARGRGGALHLDVAAGRARGAQNLNLDGRGVVAHAHALGIVVGHGGGS